MRMMRICLFHKIVPFFDMNIGKEKKSSGVSVEKKSSGVQKGKEGVLTIKNYFNCNFWKHAQPSYFNCNFWKYVQPSFPVLSCLFSSIRVIIYNLRASQPNIKEKRFFNC